MPFLAGSPIPAGVCEWDVMGGYRGEPAPLVRCETVDLEVPASAEIVIEGFISDDPATYELEGPFGEFTGLRLGHPHAATDHAGSPASPTGTTRSSRAASKARFPAPTARTA